MSTQIQRALEALGMMNMMQDIPQWQPPTNNIGVPTVTGGTWGSSVPNSVEPNIGLSTLTNPVMNTGTNNSGGFLSNLFSQGTDQYGNTTFGGGTGLQWLGAGLQGLTGLYGLYNGHQALKLARQNFAEQKALNHANYKMQAQSYNNSLRNQQSGRGYIGMSGSAMRTLGKEYKDKRAEETY